jgi:hypothetical protein
LLCRAEEYRPDDQRTKVSRRLIVVPLSEPGPRTRASHPDLGMIIELRRMDALGEALLPDWLPAPDQATAAT